jgi:GNAT superfamily N-acetyltransferase
MAWFALYVEPARRGGGIAGALLRAAGDVLLGTGRTRLASDVLVGGAGVGFADAVDARATSIDLRSILDVGCVDAADVAALAIAPRGYQLVQFRDRCPDELVDAFAVARGAMNDAPHGEMHLDDMVWDAARVRAQETHLSSFGLGSYITAAIDETSGAVAGFTEILSVGRPHTLVQEDTGVLRAHRGHGLGLAMKAANLRHALRHEPRTTRIVTWNAESNRYMRAVNERLGYRVADRWHDLELVLADVQTSSRSLL